MSLKSELLTCFQGKESLTLIVSSQVWWKRVCSSWCGPHDFSELRAVVEFYLVETLHIWSKSSCYCSNNPAISLVWKLPIHWKITHITYCSVQNTWWRFINVSNILSLVHYFKDQLMHHKMCHKNIWLSVISRIIIIMSYYH